MELVGKKLGRYQVEAELGHGGMAVVYKATDTLLDRKVAIKVILPTVDRPEHFLKRFEKEARALAQLTHPNIVGIHDFGREEDRPYLVMEYLPGGTLKERMGKPLPLRQAAGWLFPVARALHFAHQHGIVHRDVKPSNILFSESGEPMLADFGIVKLLGDEETLDLTTTGASIGTPEYMAPEQGMGLPIDARSDVYSLGVIFYELVTGRKPFRADTPMGVMLQKATRPVPSPRNFVPGLPVEVETILLKALDRDPDRRFPDMAHLAAALEGLSHTGSAKRVPAGKRSVKSLIALGIVIFLLCGGALLFGAPWLIGAILVLETQGGPTPTSPAATRLVGDIPSSPTLTPRPRPTQTLEPSSTPVTTSNDPQGKIVFTCQVYILEERNQVCLVNADGTDYRRVSQNLYSNNLYASLAPDGKSIVFSSNLTGNHEIYEMDLQGNQRQLTFGLGALFAPEISPDGRYIVFANNLDSFSRIWVMNRDGSAAYEVHAPSSGDALDPIWSPDGTHILFAEGIGEQRQLYIINRDGSGLRVVNSQFITRGRSDWSPLGDLIAGYSGLKPNREVFVMNLDGSGLRQVSNGGNAQGPSFSPDGQWIVFTAYIDNPGDNGCEIYIVKIDGTRLTRLTSNDYCDYQPRWGP